jgi:hypothetical protein
LGGSATAAIALPHLSQTSRAKGQNNPPPQAPARSRRAAPQVRADRNDLSAAVAARAPQCQGVIGTSAFDHQERGPNASTHASRSGKHRLMSLLGNPRHGARAYNFLKHADRDSDGKLGVRDIVASNDLLLYCCILRYGVLFGSRTQHMHVFSMFVQSFYPGIVELDRLPPMKKLVEAIGSLTRGEQLTQIWSFVQPDPTLQQERQEDLNDVANANASRRTA